MIPILQDPSGNWWQVGVTDAGQLVTSPSPVAGAALVLPAYFGGATRWSISIDALGRLVTTSTNAAPTVAFGNAVQLTSIGQAVYFFGVLSDGRLITNLNSPARTPWVVGMLYPIDASYPKPSQPGGVGTPVTGPEVQTPEERTGQWAAGCGHSFNTPEVIEDQIQSVRSALVVCPICRFICSIISPYDDIHATGPSGDKYPYIIP